MKLTPRAVVGAGLVLGLLVIPLGADAQSGARVVRVGFVGASASSLASDPRPFVEALAKLGWVEGQNLVIEYRWTEGKAERLPAIMGELVRLKVDVIFTPGSNAAAHAAKRATSTIPIVFTTPADPVEAGLVANLSRPGGNITGLGGTLLSGKRLELLREAAPTITRVVVLSMSANPSHPRALQETQLAARRLGVHVQSVAVRNADALEAAFATMAKGRADGLLVLGDPVFFLERERIAALAIRHRLPAMFIWREGAEAGGLISYGEARGGVPRRAADYVDRILKGARPGDLPVEQPTTFDLVINLKTARALGLTTPQSLRLRADRVIDQ